MNRHTLILLALAVAAALASCGGSGGGGSSSTSSPPPSEVVVVTQPGTPTGAAVSQSIDGSGGTVTEPQTGAAVKAEAGAFGAATDVTVQPVSDTLPSGIGDGVTVTTSQPPATPLIVTMPYDPATPGPSGLGLAVQQADGSWQSLEPVRIDTAAHTVAAALRDPPAAAVRAAGTRGRAAAPGGRTIVKYIKFWMKPDPATVHVGKTLPLVPWARQSTEHCPPLPPCDPSAGDDCLLAPVCSRPVIQDLPFTNDKPGFTRTWYVNNEVGGNSTVGTISQNSPAGATFTAPATKPSPATVEVMFGSSSDAQGGGMVFITSDVTITAGYSISVTFTGTAFPVCDWMVADVDDFFSVDLVPDANGDGGYTLDKFRNTKATVQNEKQAPTVAPASATGDTSFDMFDADGGQVAVIPGQGGDEIRVVVTGTSTGSSCTLTPQYGPPTTVPSKTVPGAVVPVDFFADAFVNGKQTPAPFPVPNSSGVFTFEVDEQ